MPSISVIVIHVCLNAKAINVAGVVFFSGLVENKIAACVNIIPGITSV